MAERKSLLFAALFVALLALPGCFVLSEKRWEYRIVDRSSRPQVVLTYDSPEVRKLLAEEDAREEEIGCFWREKHTVEEASKRFEDMRVHPELYPPGRLEFFRAIANMPGFPVPIKSYCHVLQRSKSTCGTDPSETVVYALVGITSGTAKGKQGWVCETHVHQLFP